MSAYFDLAGAHVFLQPRHRVVGVDVDRIVDLYLEDQVRTAPQIKAQVNLVLH